MAPRCVIAVAMLFATLGGCAPSAKNSYTPPPRPLGNGLLVSSAALENPLETSEPQVPSSLMLKDAFALALLHNPELASFSWAVRAAEARVLQAGLLPNPEIDVEVENFAGSGSSSGTGIAETTVTLAQPILLGGKRAKRERVAELEGRLAGWDYETKRLEVYTATARAFFSALAAQERLRVVRETVGLSERTLESVSRRVEAGRSPPAERLRSQVALSRAQIEERRFLRQVGTANIALSALWGEKKARFEKLDGDFLGTATLPAEESLLEQLPRSPRIGWWIQEEERAQAALELAKAGAIPDPTIRIGGRRLNESDDTTLVAGISLPLPVFDRNQGGRAEAGYRLAQARERKRAEETGLSSRMRSLYGELSSASVEVQVLRKNTLPAAQSALDETRQGFEKGRFGLIDVLAAQNELFDLKRQYVDALERYHLLKAEIEELLGIPFEAVPATSDQEHQP